MDAFWMLFVGAVNGAVVAGLAHLFRRYMPWVLSSVLVMAAALYVMFAVMARMPWTWLAVESAGVVLFGAFAVLGLRRSWWWLAAGWALHPVWDIALHYFGPGDAFAPDWYTVPCFSYDLAVAAYLAYRAWRPGARAPTSGTPASVAA